MFHQGHYLKQAMRQQRVTEDEILATMRSSGVSSLDELTAVVLEADGSFTVVQGGNGKPVASLQNVQRPTSSEQVATHKNRNTDGT